MRPLALALLLALGNLAQAGEAQEGSPTVLAASVNGKAVSDSAIFFEAGGVLLAKPAQWAELGLILSGEEQEQEYLSVEELGLKFTLDEPSQSIELVVPAQRLPTQKVSTAPSMPELSPPAPGLLINYNLAGQVSGSGQAVSAGHELRTSGSWGTLRSTGQLNWTDKGGVEYRRGLSQWFKDDYTRQIRYEAGDVLAAGTSHPILGGVRIAKDPTLDPYTPTWPVPTLGGVALDPATVEILANQSKVSEHDVERGNFTIERFPLQPGRNALDVVVRDEFGRSQIVSSSTHYFAPRILRKDLTIWSLSAGAIRQGHTNDYAGFGASGQVEHGLSDRWTLTGSAQTDGEAYNATVGARTVLGVAGTFELEVGKSDSESGSGKYVRGQYNYQGRNFGVAISHENTDDWWSLANNDSFLLTAKERTQASLTWQSDDRRLRARLGGADIDTGRSKTRYIDTAVSYRNGPHNISGSALYDFQRGEPTFAASYRYNFGQGSAYASARSAPNSTRFALGATARTDIANQRVSLRGELVDIDGHTGGRASATIQTSKGMGRLDIENSASGTRGAANWSGSLHLGRGGATFGGTISSGHAVVDIPGVAGATVRANGRSVGQTNSSGRLLIPQLPALTETTVKVDTKSLPAGVELESSEIVVSPRRQTGAWGQFKVLGTQGRAFTIVRTPTIEAGATVKTDKEETMAGQGGVIYLEQPSEGMTVVVEDSMGTCQAQLPDALPSFEDNVELRCQ